jgi:hypothetical protein
MNSEKEIGETAVTGWKRCTLCSYVKPTTEFHKTQNNKDGLAARCKPCFSEVQRARYARNPEAMRQRKREYHRNNPAAAKRSGLHRNGTRYPGKPWPPRPNWVRGCTLPSEGHPRPGQRAHVRTGWL